MTEKAIDETRIVVVVVGFKQDEENSVHYEKLHDPIPSTVGMSLWKAFVKGADFASIRFIRKKKETRCVYQNCCVKYPNCPKGHGDKTEDYSCWKSGLSEG